MSRKYCIISPCRDESKYVRRTLESVLAQSLRPDKWVIVDDGSTDGTLDILRQYEEEYDFIEVVHRETKERRVGRGVVEAFNFGLAEVDLTEFDFLCKLDMDLDIPPRYFQTLLDRMEQNPRLGTCSGKAYYPAKSNVEQTFDGELISEACGDDMSVGMTKFYRVKCFEDIGGFVSEVMWDGIDCHRCRMLGWEAKSWNDPEIRFIHLRPMGSSHRGIITGRIRHGFGQFFMGTSLPYMVASACFRMTRPPFVIGGCAMMYGYLKSMIMREPRYGDLEFRKFLRRYQWLCLIKGKKQAAAAIELRVREQSTGKYIYVR